ncbi:MAG: cupin domain-containing protein [Pseudohongiellaceae bacterium]
MSGFKLNPEFDASHFVQHYWQKKPLLLRNLIPNFSDSLSAEELAGLACEDLVESRLVSEFEPGRWQLRNGPFEESDFTQLPPTNWTLLVQAVDQWVEDVAELKTLFEFIPSWRIDDIMVSFATAGGSVGPHYDYYDVFLLQGSGSRNWKVGERCNSAVELIQDSELSLLSNFETVVEFDLAPGDALYLPPRFSHWGVASSDSLCYSIGFRAPSMAEMIEGFSDFVIKQQDPAQRFEDSEIASNMRRGEINPGQLDDSFRQLTERFAEKEKFVAWFGCYVSQPKYPELIVPVDQPFSKEQFQSLLTEDVVLAKNPSSRFAFIESSAASSVLLFVDGAMVVFPLEQLKHITALCASTHITPEQAYRLFSNSEMAELLRQLLNQGSLLVSE